jgi:hypothetical protein
VYAHSHARAGARTHNTHTHTRTDTNTHTHACAHMRTITHMRTIAHTHTHTLTRAPYTTRTPPIPHTTHHTPSHATHIHTTPHTTHCTPHATPNTAPLPRTTQTTPHAKDPLDTTLQAAALFMHDHPSQGSTSPAHRISHGATHRLCMQHCQQDNGPDTGDMHAIASHSHLGGTTDWKQPLLYTGSRAGARSCWDSLDY